MSIGSPAKDLTERGDVLRIFNSHYAYVPGSKEGYKLLRLVKKIYTCAIGLAVFTTLFCSYFIFQDPPSLAEMIVLVAGLALSSVGLVASERFVKLGCYNKVLIEVPSIVAKSLRQQRYLRKYKELSSDERNTVLVNLCKHSVVESILAKATLYPSDKHDIERVASQQLDEFFQRNKR